MNKSKKTVSEIKEIILSGKCSEGSRLPSGRALAKTLGVSLGTVTNALSTLAGEGYVRKMHGSGSYVAARKRRNSNPSICFLIDVMDDKLNPIWHLIYENFYLQSAGSGVKIELKVMPRERPLEIKDSLKDFDLIAVALGLTPEIIGMLVGIKRPLLWLDESCDILPGATICCDNFMAGSIVAEHFISQGCHKLAYMTYSFDGSRHYPSERRFDGFLAGVRNSKAEGCSVSSLSCFPESKSFRDEMKSCLINIDGLFCFEDNLAVKVATAVAPSLRPPSDFALAGIDDTPLGRFVTPPLTSVRQPCEEIGRESWNFAKRILGGEKLGEILKVKPELVVRESSMKGSCSIPNAI